MFDPHTALVGSAWQLQYLVYETLMTMGTIFRPAGPRRIREMPSPTPYVFTCAGVKFSNGRT